MEIIVICLVALFVAGLTFFSGFGLGTLLLPAFSLFSCLYSYASLFGNLILILNFKIYLEYHFLFMLLQYRLRVLFMDISEKPNLKDWSVL